MPASAATRWAVARVIWRSVAWSTARRFAAASARALASRVTVMIACCCLLSVAQEREPVEQILEAVRLEHDRDQVGLASARSC